MKLDNPFPLEVRVLFLYVYSCFRCKRSDRGLEIHHIVGRSSSSAFNACVLCKDCHAHIGHSKEEEKEMFSYTMKFLLNENYKPIEKDYNFLRDNPHLIL